jgi:hypothetical protein
MASRWGGGTHAREAKAGVKRGRQLPHGAQPVGADACTLLAACRCLKAARHAPAGARGRPIAHAGRAWRRRLRLAAGRAAEGLALLLDAGGRRCDAARVRAVHAARLSASKVQLPVRRMRRRLRRPWQLRLQLRLRLRPRMRRARGAGGGVAAPADRQRAAPGPAVAGRRRRWRPRRGRVHVGARQRQQRPPQPGVGGGGGGRGAAAGAAAGARERRRAGRPRRPGPAQPRPLHAIALFVRGLGQAVARDPMGARGEP